MDIQTEYQDRLMKKKVPGLSEYLSTRKCNNKTGKPYSAEPLDERLVWKKMVYQMERLKAVKLWNKYLSEPEKKKNLSNINGKKSIK